MRTRWLGLLAAMALVASTVYAQTDTPIPPNCADEDAYCSDATPAMLLADTGASIEVAGVQTAADDARTPAEDEPFIVNTGFGD
jgi:hypothetical protein